MKVAAHAEHWRLIRGLLKPVAGAEKLLLTQEWPYDNDLWKDELYKDVAVDLGLTFGKVVHRCYFDKAFKKWFFASNKPEWGDVFPKTECRGVHEHVKVELKDTGFYPIRLGRALLTTAEAICGGMS